MSEIISCPSCHRKLQVPETLAGQDVQCPTCGATFVAQVAAAPSARSERPPLERWDAGGAGGRPPAYNRPYERPSDWRPQPGPGGYDDYDDYDQRHRRDLMPHRGTLILVLGLLSVLGIVLGVTCVLGPIAWIMGNTDMAEIRAG